MHAPSARRSRGNKVERREKSRARAHISEFLPARKRRDAIGNVISRLRDTPIGDPICWCRNDRSHGFDRFDRFVRFDARRSRVFAAVLSRQLGSAIAIADRVFILRMMHDLTYEGKRQMETERAPIKSAAVFFENCGHRRYSVDRSCLSRSASRFALFPDARRETALLPQRHGNGTAWEKWSKGCRNGHRYRYHQRALGGTWGAHVATRATRAR